MKENEKCKTCLTCRYLEFDQFGRAHVCVNDKSDNLADFVSTNDTCEYHEDIPREEWRVIDMIKFLQWLEHQKKCIAKNSECYKNADEILDQMDIIEEYLWWNKEKTIKES